MARRKLSRIKDYDLAKSRLAAIKSIDGKLDLANGISVTSFETSIEQFTTLLDKYNTALSTVDELYNQCENQLLIVKDQNERVLAGIASKYGKNSNEYEMAGGTKKSDRKKIVKTKAKA